MNWRAGSDLDSLKNVPGTAFEVVQMTPIYTAANVPSGAAPSIGSFTVTPGHVSAGGSVSLAWNVSGASYLVVSPGVGAVRGSSATVKPAANTTYTLYATNQYSPTSATVTVTVP